jgi:hypothetical protein
MMSQPLPEIIEGTWADRLNKALEGVITSCEELEAAVLASAGLTTTLGRYPCGSTRDSGRQINSTVAGTGE